MLKLSLLGKPTIILPGTETEAALADFGTTKVQALLFYLVVTGEAHARDSLAELLWGNDSVEKARRSLRTALSGLTKRLPNYIESDRTTIRFRPQQPHLLDLATVQTLATTLDAPVLDKTQLQEAVTLYRGEFLQDFYVVDAPVFEAWLLTEREYWRDLMLDLLAALTASHLRDRDYHAAITSAEQLLAIEPWDEESHRTLMTTYSRLGEWNRALVQYERCRELLNNELDVPPAPETEALVERIRSARQARPHNLPAVSTPIVGRRAALSQLANLLDNPAVRLITLVGLGGIGKTRLVLEAAAVANQEQAIQFLNGVIWVPLAGIERPEGIAPAIANALGIPSGGRANPERELLGYLRNKELLLVLDNLEHLITATPLLEAVLTEAPDVKLLVTSRRPLGITAEWRLDLDGLAFPLETLENTEDNGDEAWESVELFAQMAQQVQPSFALTVQTRPSVQRLCRLVAGIPLALKLASMWLRLMSVEQIVEEVTRNLDLLTTPMRDLPPRQRSMRAVYDYTWSLLTDDEQYILAALTRFRGGWDEAGAQAVANATPELLARLVDRSLIHVDVVGTTMRYGMHELTRQYATEQLIIVDAVNRAHSEHFVAVANRVYTQFLSTEQPYSIEILLRENDNLAATWQWLVSQIKAPHNHTFAVVQLERYVTPLGWYCNERSLYLYGATQYNTAVEAIVRWLTDESIDSQHIVQRLYIQLQLYLAIFHYSLGNFATIEAITSEILPVVNELGDPRLEAATLEIRARAYYRRGKNAAAKTLLEQSIERFISADDRFGEMQATSTLAYTLANEGDYAASIPLQQQVAEYYRSIQYDVGVARLLTNLSSTYERQQQPAAAQPLLEEAFAIADRHNHRFLRMFVRSNLASVLSALGEQEQAEIYRRESLAIAQELDDQYWIALNYNGLSRIYLRMDDLQKAGECAQQAFDVAHTIRGEPALLSSIGYLAQVWLRQGKIEAGLRGLFYVHHHPAALAWDRDLTASLVTELSEELPESVMMEAEAWCRAHGLDDAVSWFRSV